MIAYALCALVAGSAPPLVELGPNVLYLLGVSPKGALAWAEAHPGMDSEGAFWIVAVTDLDSDKRLATLEEHTQKPKLEALEKKAGAAIGKMLEKFGVQRQALTFARLPIVKGDDEFSIAVRSGRVPADASESRSHAVELASLRQGRKTLGRLESRGPESGDTPLDTPSVAGVIESPFEARIAVLLTQRGIGVEATPFIQFTWMGGKLSGGFR